MRRWLVAMLALCAAGEAVTEASVIQLPTIGGRSAALSGNDVALAADGPGMLLVNDLFAVGLWTDLGRWPVLGTLGTEDRVVNGAPPTAAPGRYEWESSVVSFEVVHRL